MLINSQGQSQGQRLDFQGHGLNLHDRRQQLDSKVAKTKVNS